MYKVVIFNTQNISAENEVNQLLSGLRTNWRLASIQVTTTPWGEGFQGVSRPMHLYYTTVVVLEEK